MAQIFTPRSNTLARVSIVVMLLCGVGTLVVLDSLHRFPYGTEVDIPKEQPIPFSHKHHANMGIDCRYCHFSVEKSSFAGIPPTEVCMNCHSMVWKDTPMLAPVRESWRNGTPMEWNRVHDLPQFVYFDHSIHVKKGIGCSTCHGQVNEMPLIRKQNTLYMGWCIECHRAPEKFVRPVDQVVSMDYKAPANQEALGLELIDKNHVDTSNNRMLDCTLCHR